MAQTRRAHVGTLRIGDQWSAINIIARSQTHPLKAVCELVENSIDARATEINIVRRRRKDGIFLEVIDDGNGIIVDDRGHPDFAHIASHICDSMKNNLDERDRDGIHGEFGIGLLSFWSLGNELRLISASLDHRLYEMKLKRSGRHYNIRQIRGQLDTGGTRIVVGPLLDSTRNIVTGEKLQRYLSVELRDRIRNSRVQIQITDKVARKSLKVEPCAFEGERLEEIKNVFTKFGDVGVELYLRSGKSSNSAAVGVYKDGTRVLTDISELEQFQRSPWTDRRLEGVIDYPDLNLAPGTRCAVVPDEKQQAFVNAVGLIEPMVVEAIERRDRAQTETASRRILRQLHKAFASALRDMPTNDYLFFDIPDTQRIHRNAAKKKMTSADHETQSTERSNQAEHSDVSSGRLQSVLINRKNPERQLVGRHRKSLPSYRLQAEGGEIWRSRYGLEKNEIVINSAHRDCIASRSTPAKHRKYLGKLFAKEIVLLNFPHLPASEVMERMIEVIFRTEDSL